MADSTTAFWFRRDLRLEDNCGLFHALTSGAKVIPVFIFDSEIIDSLPEDDARISFIYQALERLHQRLVSLGSGLVVKKGKPLDVWQTLHQQYQFSAIYYNHDYEPYAKHRDPIVEDYFTSRGVGAYSFKDQVIFEKSEVLSNSGTPYTVFTPYSKKWKAQLASQRIASYPSQTQAANFAPLADIIFPSLASIGFKQSTIPFPSAEPSLSIITHYHERRNFPAISGTSRLGVHLRFGTISIRHLAALALQNNETYLNELIWREFYMQILWHFPHVAHSAFRPAYDLIPWREDKEAFERWCQGKTGFPIVDAGIRELNATGYMHNRVRMISASFLIKDLLIDWRWGEAYFAGKLLDFELASNNGGWQWAASSGTDAAPYFRIFNPESQQKKFDPEAKYIRKWVPEYGTPLYPRPIVDHKAARLHTLEVFKSVLKPS